MAAVIRFVASLAGHYGTCTFAFRAPCIATVICPEKKFLSTDESPFLTTIAAGYNWTQLISMVVLVFLVAVIGIWWLLHTVGKPDLVISSDTYQ